MSNRGRGEGTLRKRKDGRWEGRIVVGHKDDGKPIYKSVFSKSKGECSEKLNKLIEETQEAQMILNRCAFLDTANPTLQEWYDIWMNSFCKVSIKEYTASSYANFFEKKILPKLGGMRIKEISTVTCQQLLTDLYLNGREQYRGRKGTGLSAKTVKDIKIAFQTCMQKAVDEEIIKSNPVRKVELPKAPKKEMQTLKANEIAAFMNEARESFCYEFYFLEISTGLRLGEILALTWDDLDIKKKTITVNKQVQRINGKVQITTQKTDASIRTINLSNDCIQQLMALRSRQRLDTQLMFPSPVTGGLRDPSSVTRKLHRMQQRAGIPQIRFHDLRHSFATLSLEQGMDIKTVSHMLGHTDAGFTMNTYMHVTDKMQQTVADTMGTLISTEEQNKRNKVIQFTA